MEHRCRTVLGEGGESARPTVTLLIGLSSHCWCWAGAPGARGQAQTPLTSLGRSNAMTQAAENHDRDQIN